ncbi:MAG: efflux RND transporter periplasmic adaptor subunit, partial [Sphingobium sp.]
MSRTYPLLPLLLSSTMAFPLAACSNAEADPRTGPQLVRVATAGAASETSRSFSGIVSARVQSDLG